MTDFLTDVETLRRRARQNIEQGPITEAYGADRERVVAVLNEALATEIVCVLRYKRHYYTATGINAGPVAAELLEHEPRGLPAAVSGLDRRQPVAVVRNVGLGLLPCGDSGEHAGDDCQKMA